MLSYLPWFWLSSFDYLCYNYYKCMITFTHYFFAKTIMLINRRGNIYVSYDITKLNVYTEGKRTRYKISSNIRITNVQSCNALIFLRLKIKLDTWWKTGDPIPATLLCLSQTRTRISKSWSVLRQGSEGEGDYSLCWNWWNCWPSHIITQSFVFYVGFWISLYFLFYIFFWPFVHCKTITGDMFDGFQLF